MEAFGVPSSIFRDDVLCAQSWLDLGLTINFANLGGANPCGSDGRIGTTQIEGPLAAEAGWETSEGIRADMAVDEVRSIFPGAYRAEGGLVMIEGPTPFGPDGVYAVVSATTAGGRTDLTTFSVGAAGE